MFYKCRAKFGSFDVAEAKRLRALGAENAKLKIMLEEHILDVGTLKAMLEKTSDA